MTEGRGTGIPKILRVLKENGSPPPQFKTDEDRTFFTTDFFIHPLFVSEARKAEQVTGEVTGEVTSEVIRLLSVLVKAPMTRSQAQKFLGLKSQANFRDRYLEPASNLGLIEMTIPDKPRSSKQKYRLTEKGRGFLSSIRKKTKE